MGSLDCTVLSMLEESKLSFLIREPEKWILQVRQVSKRHLALFLLRGIVLPCLPQVILLPPIRVRQE